MIPRFVEVVNLGDKAVTITDRGLSATGGKMDIPPSGDPGDPLISTVPREVWVRQRRRHLASAVMERRSAIQRNLIAAEPLVKPVEVEPEAIEPEPASSKRKAGKQAS